MGIGVAISKHHFFTTLSTGRKTRNIVVLMGAISTVGRLRLLYRASRELASNKPEPTLGNKGIFFECLKQRRRFARRCLRPRLGK